MKKLTAIICIIAAAAILSGCQNSTIKVPDSNSKTSTSEKADVESENKSESEDESSSPVDSREESSEDESQNISEPEQTSAPTIVTNPQQSSSSVASATPEPDGNMLTFTEDTFSISADATKWEEESSEYYSVYLRHALDESIYVGIQVIYIGTSTTTPQEFGEETIANFPENYVIEETNTIYFKDHEAYNIVASLDADDTTVYVEQLIFIENGYVYSLAATYLDDTNEDYINDMLDVFNSFNFSGIR